MDKIIRHPAFVVIQVFFVYNKITKRGGESWEGIRNGENGSCNQGKDKHMALFVLRQAFKTELVIRREDLGTGGEGIQAGKPFSGRGPCASLHLPGGAGV